MNNIIPNGTKVVSLSDKQQTNERRCKRNKTHNKTTGQQEM